MATIINIFDKQVNASANALCYSLGLTDKSQFPLSRFVLHAIYKRAYEGPHECRTPAEIREDFTGFRQDIKQSLPYHKQSISLFLDRTDLTPDSMMALCLGHDILATSSESDMADMTDKQINLVKITKAAHHLVHSRPYVGQDNIDDLKPVELFTLLVKLRDHFQPLLHDLQNYGKRANPYTLSAIQKNLGTLHKFRPLDLGRNALSQRVSLRLAEITDIDKNYGLSQIGKREHPHP